MSTWLEFTIIVAMGLLVLWFVVTRVAIWRYRKRVEEVDREQGDVELRLELNRLSKLQRVNLQILVLGKRFANDDDDI